MSDKEDQRAILELANAAREELDLGNERLPIIPPVRTIIPIKPCPIDLSMVGLESVIKQYGDTFGYEPGLLIIEPSNHFQAEELLAGVSYDASKMLCEEVRWLPYGAWMVASYHGRGIIYSEGA